MRRFLSTVAPKPRPPRIHNVIGMDHNAARSMFARRGEPAFRGDQLVSAAHKAGGGVYKLDDIHTLPLNMREVLKDEVAIDRGSILQAQQSIDGTVKMVHRFPSPRVSWSKPVRVETVVLPGSVLEEEDETEQSVPATVCVSSQAGCSFSCSFCYTGTQGLVRNLSAGEIVAQVLNAEDFVRFGRLPGMDGEEVDARALGLKRKEEGMVLDRVRNVVFMGMGEPLLNFRAVGEAVKVLVDEKNGLGLSPRRITLSTSGVAPLMARVGSELGVRLALSLHAAEQTKREKLVGPAAKQWNLTMLQKGIEDYLSETQRVRGTKNRKTIQTKRTSKAFIAAADNTRKQDRQLRKDSRNYNLQQHPQTSFTPTHTSKPNLSPKPFHRWWERVSLEWVVLPDINTTQKDVDQIVEFVTPIGIHHFHINLIPFNPWPSAPYAGATMEDAKEFAARLQDKGLHVTIRTPKGRDILAACGQLKDQSN